MAGRGMSLSVNTQLVTEECCSCGVLFALPADLKDVLRRATSARRFYCPNGHSQHYTGESDEDKIARLQAALTHERDQRQAERRDAARKLSAAKGEVTKARKRAAAGVCGFCHRTFANVARHVETKHPAETSPQVVNSARSEGQTGHNA